MYMNSASLAALKKSIKKWEQIVEGKEVDRGTENCALCELFFYFDCYGCPVRRKTQSSGCNFTPYSFFQDAFSDDMKDITGERPKIGEHSCVIGPRSMRVALEELDFLTSLLP